MPDDPDITFTLKARGIKYGDFADVARIAQRLKYTMTLEPGWKTLSDDKREALEMIAHKISRILNGNPELHDNWHDIQGYAQLVAARLKPGKSDDVP